MDGMWYLAVFLSAFAVDSIPLFAPPAWTVAVFLLVKFRLQPLIVLPLCIPVLIFGAGAVTAAESGLSPDGHFYLLGAMFLLAALGAPVATAAALRISV